MGTYPLTNVIHLLCLSSHEYHHVLRRVDTNITVGAVGNQPSYQLDNPELLLERHCTFSKPSSTFWVSPCNCNKWLKLQIIPCMSLSAPPTHHFPHCFSHSTQPEKCVHPSLPNSTEIRSQMLFHTQARNYERILKLLLFLKLQGLSSLVSTWLYKLPSMLHLPNRVLYSPYIFLTHSQTDSKLGASGCQWCINNHNWAHFKFTRAPF